MAFEERRDTVSPASMDDDKYATSDDDRDANYDPKDDDTYDDEKDDIEPKDEKVQEVENEDEFLKYKKFTRNELIDALIRDKTRLRNAKRRIRNGYSKLRRERRKLELQNRIMNDLMECYSLKPSDIAILKQQILKSNHDKKKRRES